MKRQKKWTKFRHKMVVFFIGMFVRPYLRLRYGVKVYKPKVKIPRPSLIMCNHQATMDPFFLTAYFYFPIYYIMSDDFFSMGFFSKLMSYLVAPIPKSKSKSDISTVRNSLKVLKEGGTVGVFPSGNRSISGKPWEIDVSSARFAKMTKVPLVLVNIFGGYGSDPRWGKGVRRGRLSVCVREIIPAETVKQMSEEQLYQKIVDGLNTEDYMTGIEFKSKRRAEFIERALYYCPNCKSFNTIESKGSKFYCKNCDFSAEYNKDLTFKPIKGEVIGKTIADWSEVQRQKLQEQMEGADQRLFSDCVESTFVKDGKREKFIGANIHADKNKIVVQRDDGQILEFAPENFLSMTFMGKRKLAFYLSDGRVLQVRGDKRFNAIKYLHVYEILKGKGA